MSIYTSSKNIYVGGKLYLYQNSITMEMYIDAILFEL